MLTSKLTNILSFNKFIKPYRLLYETHSRRNVSSSKWLCDKKSKDGKKSEKYMDPTCKVAIVTGGATGIGYAVSCHLLCEGAKHVVIGGINRKEGLDAIHKLNSKFGNDKACFMDCDVSNECDFDNLFKETKKCFGDVEILFNNAGMLEDRKWSLTVDTNIKGTLLGCFLAFKHMGKDHGGKGGLVVNNASILGLQASPGIPVYTCTKHAVIGITKCLGHDFHYHRTCVRMCSICPGVTNTVLISGATNKQFCEEWGKEGSRHLGSLPSQEPGFVGEAFVSIVRYGVSGEHYIIEGAELHHAKIPDRHSFSTKIHSYK